MSYITMFNVPRSITTLNRYQTFSYMNIMNIIPILIYTSKYMWVGHITFKYLPENVY